MIHGSYCLQKYSSGNKEKRRTEKVYEKETTKIQGRKRKIREGEKEIETQRRRNKRCIKLGSYG